MRRFRRRTDSREVDTCFSSPIFPVQCGDMADRLNQLTTGSATDLLYHDAPGIPICGVDSHLDQLVVIQCLIDFLDDGVTEPGLPGEYDRFEGVGQFS